MIKEKTEEEIRWQMQEKLRIKKRKKLQKKLTRDASSQNPKSKHTLEFDEVSVKINPPLLQEFID